MCGIAGVAVAGGRVSPETLTRMRDALAHRGPDDAGLWVSSDGTVGLGHRRLSILDLSGAARQPMADEAAGIRVTYNGEIYNFREIRRDLEGLGHCFVTQSDTEVLLKAYRQWGAACLARLNGMFAFGIYDARARQVFLARDRAGEKPLYYVDRPGYFAFASELKALLADAAQSYCVDLDGLNFYFAYGYIPGDRCILGGVRKLPPAHALRYDLGTGRAEVWRYWTPPLPCAQEGDEEALVSELERLLMDSVRLRMISDVPLGVLLSGGVDSSLVAAAAATQSSGPVKTFTVTFPGEGGYDESARARRIATHIGTEHHELEAAPAGPDLLREMALQFDEPLADSSLLPTFLVSRLTRGHVTVALGGDGGDELFGGYGHYVRAETAVRRYGWVPTLLWKALASAAARLPAGVKGRAHLLSLRGGPFQAAIHGTPYFDLDLRRRAFGRGALLSLQGDLDAPERFKSELWQARMVGLDAMMRLDFETYLPDDILAKVDRASMRVALEVRAPWLDHRIVEFAFGKVSPEWKVEGGITRRLQRALARRLLPADADLGRKQGFSIPLAQWMAGPWGPFVETVLRGASAPHVDWGFALRLWEGQRRRRSNGARLFALLMYELWWQAYGRQVGAG